MMHIRITVIGAVALLAIGLTGCQQPNFSEMMAPPERPVELDRLAMFVGQWEGTCEGTMTGCEEAMKSKGTSEAKWDADRWVLVERMEYTMGEGKDETKMAGICVWSWDARAKKYRMNCYDNFGTCGTGMATYDEDTRTWHMTNKGRYADGTAVVGEGTTVMVDENTMEWNYTEWDSWKLTKFMEMEGTIHRR